MHIRYSYTRLLVRNFEKCLVFYRDVLGFKPRFGDTSVYEEFLTGPVVIALFRCDLMNQALGIKPPQNDPNAEDTVVLIFEVPNVDAACTDLESKGVKIISAPTDREEWMIRTAHFRDPEGNLIEINSPLSGKV